MPNPEKILRIDSGNYEFTFINLTKVFKDKIDWNFNDYGKLWNYNLQYADFLKAKNIKKECRRDLVLDLYKKLWSGRVPLEPYPASLRIMNVIRFISEEFTEREDRNEILIYLCSELNYLSKNLEYHLLANHLLENAFALLMGGHFFNHTPWEKVGSTLLRKELKEQILLDGAHFELSPMYHQIILFRVIEAYTYLNENDAIKPLLRNTAVKMLSWLQCFSFRNGAVPHFNDSTDGICLTVSQLRTSVREAGIFQEAKVELSNSGYRKFEFDDFEVVFDVHGISPGYQPGHAHADTFSFCLNYKNIPFIVDAGTSTYEISAQRDWERSTRAHNTIEIGDKNSSEVWAGFRVGRRAKVQIIEESKYRVKASHDGYRFLGARVYRSFKVDQSRLVIEDKIESSKRMNNPIVGRIHLHPDVSLQTFERKVILSDSIIIEFEEKVDLSIEDFDVALGFNHRVKSKCISYKLQGSYSRLLIYQFA